MNTPRHQLPEFPVQYENWMAKARCADSNIDPTTFYDPQRVTEAQTICATCPVTNDCLSFAIRNRETTGVWGGQPFTGKNRELQKIRKQLEGDAA